VALLVAMFSIPGGLGAGGKLAWAYTSYALFQLAYSFVNIPYGSLSAVMTQEPDERAKLSTGRVIALQPRDPAHRRRRLTAGLRLGPPAEVSDHHHDRLRARGLRTLRLVLRARTVL
jgi:hypothetical protein